jgi:hypothetical protein
MKTNLRILCCGALLSFLPALALAADATGAEGFLDKILPPLPQSNTTQVSGVFYVSAVTGTAECRADRIADLKKGDTIDARGANVRTKENSTATLVFSNHTSIFVQQNTELRVEKFDQEPFAPNNNLLIEPSNSQLIIFVRLGQIVISTPQLLAGTRIVFETPHAACYVVNQQSGGEKAFLEVSASQTHYAMVVGEGRVKIREKDGTLASIGTTVPKGQQAFVRYAWNGKGDDEDKSHPPGIDVTAGGADAAAAATTTAADSAAPTSASPIDRTPWGIAVPADEFYVATLSGTVRGQTKDRSFDLKVGDTLIARDTIIKTEGDSHVSLVLGNETRLSVNEKSELKFDKFDQEPFAPNNNLDVEPSNSQMIVLMRAGQMDIDTPQLLSGTTLVFETPHGAIGIQNNQSGGQQASLEVTTKNTHVQMVRGLASVREKGPDGDFVNLGYDLKTGEQASVKPTLGADPTLAAASFDEIKAAAGVPPAERGKFAVTKAAGTIEYTVNGKTVALHKGDSVSGTGASIRTGAGAKATLVFSNQTSLTLAENSALTVDQFKQQPSIEAATQGVETSQSDSHFRLTAGQVDVDAPQLAISSSLVFETVHSSISIPDGQAGGARATLTLTEKNTQCRMLIGQAEIKQRGLDGTFVNTGTLAKAGDLAVVKPVLAAGASETSIMAIDVDAAPVAPEGSVATTTSTDAVVLRVLGSAKFTLPGETAATSVGLDTQLPVGSSVETMSGAEVYLQPYPGAIAVLRPNSRMLVEKLSVTTAGDVLMKREIIFDLKAGSLVSMIDPAKHNINRYAVRTPKGLAKAQGTSFTTSVTGDDMTVATTADSVSFTTPAGVTYTVNAGNVTESTAGGAAQTPISLSQEVSANPAFAAVVQAAMNTVSNIVQNNIGNLPTNSAANLMAQVAAVASAAIPANAGAYATQAVTAVTTAGSSTSSRPGAAAAAVIAAIVTAAPSQAGAVTTAGVQAAPSQMDAVAGAAAKASPTQAGAVTTAALAAYSSANPQGTSQNFAQTANSVAAAVTNAAPGSASGVAAAAMTAITQNNPTANPATVTQNAANLAATVTAQAPTQGAAVATAVIGVVTTANPGGNSAQVTSSVDAGVTAGQQVAASNSSNGGGNGNGGNGGNGNGGGGGGNGVQPTAVVITQTNGGNGNTGAGGNGNGGNGGNGNGGGGNAGNGVASNGNGGNGNGGNGNGGNGNGGNGNGNGGNGNGGNGNGGGNGGQQSTSVIITQLNGGTTGTASGTSQSTSILVTQLNGGQQAALSAAVTAASNAGSTVNFSTNNTSSGGSNTGGTSTVTANPTTSTTPPTNFAISAANLAP